MQVLHPQNMGETSPLKMKDESVGSHADWFLEVPDLRSRKFPSITTEEACDRPQGFFLFNKHPAG